MPTAVEIHQLSKTYSPPQGWRRQINTAPVEAVADVTLSITSGETFGLLGPNGAGKTTLVKMLCTLLRPSSGTAVIAGYPLKKAAAIRAHVSLVVSDERSFYWRLSARHNLNFFAAMYGLRGETARQRIDTILADVDLADVAERRFSNFSSGMRQRLAIARALLHQPQILFLDEPSRSLDPTATHHLHDLIIRLQQEQQMTIFLITHDLAEAEKLSDRVALMHKGRIQATGKPANLRRQLQPQHTYTIQTGPGDTTDLQTQFPTIQQDADGLHFQAEDEDGMLTAVLDHLQQRQISIKNIQSSPPTLEEVFAHFTQDHAS
ncbi:MAG: ABC transporter ATP-binding protein [Chloroflexi bacterium]|nr:ABC transporter ATP-binding protein [Chloroflexota bacterium]